MVCTADGDGAWTETKIGAARAGRMEISQARLLCLRAAWMMDRHGNKAARTEVSAIKVVAARLQTKIADRAAGLRRRRALQRYPLAFIYGWGRALRFIGGPDEVHLRAVARAEIRKRRESGRSVFEEQGVVRPWVKGVG